MELDELTGFPDFIPVHLNLQIKFDEIRHKESHQMKCLHTVKLHLEQLQLFSHSSQNSILLPESLNPTVYQDFLLHPRLVDMVFGNCLDIVDMHETFLDRLDAGFVEYVNRIPELTAEYCTLISQHYEDNRTTYGALISEVVFTSELIELLTSKCPEFAYFLKRTAEKSQQTLTPHRGKYSLAGVYQNIARHIMSYSNFFSVIEDLSKQKISAEWESTVEKVKESQMKIKRTIKYLNDLTEDRCMAHACLGTIAEVPLCVLFSRGQSLRMKPAIVKFGFNSKPKDESVLYFFSNLIEIAQKRRPYSILLSAKDDNKTQMHCFHLHLVKMKSWHSSRLSASSNVVKVSPAKEAVCTLKHVQNMVKSLTCKSATDEFCEPSPNGHSKQNVLSSIFLKFSDASVMDAFLSQMNNFA